MRNIQPENEIPQKIDTKIDLLYLNKIVDGAEHLKSELVAIFITVISKESEDIRHWFEEKEWQALCFSFHKIRSNLRMMGLTWLAYKAEVYEQCCNNLEDRELISEELDWFLKELKKGVLQAESIIDKIGGDTSHT